MSKQNVDTATEAVEIDADLAAEAREAGYDPELYAAWVAAAKQAGVTVEEYIDSLGEAAAKADVEGRGSEVTVAELEADDEEGDEEDDDDEEEGDDDEEDEDEE